MPNVSMHILIVEDDADNARLLELALRSSRHGAFACARTRSLSAALERLTVERYDVVLLDLTLPDSRGLETLARVRARSRQTPVVVLTGTTDHAVAMRALQEGAQDYLIKGQVDADAIARAVRYVIERRRAEREVEASRMRLELAAESTQLGIWDWDLRTGKLVWTRPMADIFGINELEGTFEIFERFVHPEDRAKRQMAINDAIAERILYHREIRFVREDGTIRWVESRGRAVYDGEPGNATRMIGTVLDITARKQAEEEARARDTAVAHLARVSLVGQMAAGLAHELNQPLGAILNYAAVGVAQLDAATPDLDEARRSFDEVMEEARRAGQIIRRIRAFLRKQEVKHVPIDVRDTVQRSVALMRFELDRAGVRATVGLPGDLPRVAGDVVQVEQVIVNLIYNAIEAMASTPTNQRTLNVDAVVDGTGKHVRISVADAGSGLEPAVADRLFEPFYTTKAHGLGMGLNLSRTIVESMGGVIGATRNPAGRGTIFSFTIPVADASASAHVSEAGPAGAIGANTVLEV